MKIDKIAWSDPVKTRFKQMFAVTDKDRKNYHAISTRIGSYMKNKILISFWIITIFYFCSYSILASELHKAAAAGDIKKLKMLLSQGKDINEIETINNRDEEGDHKSQRTPLHCAIEAGKDETVIFLIKKGADVNAVSIYTDCCEIERNTPLDIAVSKGNKKIANLLLQSGANVEGIPDNKDWPLAEAIEEGYIEIAQILLDHGADINRSTGIYNVFENAIKNNQVKSLKFLLLKSRPVNGLDSALHIAAMDGDGKVEIAQILIDHDADINSHDSYDGSTPLHIAIKECHKIFAEFLLSKGVNIDLTDNNGDTPLHKAVEHGEGYFSKYFVELLLSKGARTDIKNQSGKTPLMLAEEKGAQTIIDLLKNAK